MYPVFDKAAYKRLAKKNMNILMVPKRFFRDVKYSVQRVRRGYCDADIWSIDYWFLHTMPDMLLQLKNNRGGSPVMMEPDEDGNMVIVPTEEASQKWDDILKKMAFLLTEADEESCSRKNIYEKEFWNAHAEYDEKYGEVQGNDKSPIFSDIPEYKAICRKYWEEEKAIGEYRNECKNKALELFSKYFWNLGD